MERDLADRCGSCGFFTRLRPRPEGGHEGACRLNCWPSPLADTATCPNHKPVGASFEGALERKPVAGSPRRRRDSEPAAPPQRQLPREIDIDMDRDEFRDVLRQVLREELGVGDARLAQRWRGGEVVLRPGKSDTQEKTIPIDAFFTKIVMVRDKLRVLEQKVNGHKGLSADEKVQMQQYITSCYGSLTTFNVLFNEREDGFVGQRGKG